MHVSCRSGACATQTAIFDVFRSPYHSGFRRKVELFGRTIDAAHFAETQAAISAIDPASFSRQMALYDVWACRGADFMPLRDECLVLGLTLELGWCTVGSGKHLPKMQVDRRLSRCHCGGGTAAVGGAFLATPRQHSPVARACQVEVALVAPQVYTLEGRSSRDPPSAQESGVSAAVVSELRGSLEPAAPPEKSPE